MANYSGPYANWDYPPNWVYPPWDFDSDFENGQDWLLLQWWDPRYNEGEPVYPERSYYNVTTQPYATIEEDPTAPSGSHVLHLEAWAPDPNPYNRVYLGGMEYSPYRYDRLHVSFYFKVDSPQAHDFVMFSDATINWDGPLSYVSATDQIRIEDNQYNEHFFPRSDDWQFFEYYQDYLTGEWYIKLDNTTVASGTEIAGGWIPAYYGEFYFMIGVDFLTNIAGEVADALTVNFYVDQLEVDFGPERSSWSCDCESDRFESQFGDFAYESDGTRDYFPATVTESGNTFLRFDSNREVADKAFRIHERNELSFDIRMPNPSDEDASVFWYSYAVSIENYHDASFYDFATQLLIYYDASTDRFRLDCSQYGSGTLIWPYMGPDLDVSWPRPETWQTIRCVWDYPNRKFTLEVDGNVLASYTVSAFEDVREWTDPWDYVFYPTGVNWIGWIYVQWGDVDTGPRWPDPIRYGALIDIDNISSNGRSEPRSQRGGIAGMGMPRPYTAQLYRRTGDYTQGAPLALPPTLHFQVSELEWSAIGGCDLATIRATGPEAALWHLANVLLSAVEIYDGHDALVWWGYVSELEITTGNFSFGVSLDSMANRIAVAYSYVTAGFATGSRATTDWAQDTDSVAEYGILERLESMSQADDLEAEARRDALLEQYRYPIPKISFGGESLGASLTCRGWYHLLKRRYYSNEGSDYAIETTSQIEAIVEAVGDHFRGVDIIDPSGVFTSDYSDGDSNAWAQIEDLLRVGTTNSRRLLVQVTPTRYLRIYEEPSPGLNDYNILSDGRVEDRFGRALRPSQDVVGHWARLKDVVPASVDTSRMADPSRIFIERATYMPEELELRFESRGIDLLSIGRIRVG